jgi:hypothetical protein
VSITRSTLRRLSLLTIVRRLCCRVAYPLSVTGAKYDQFRLLQCSLVIKKREQEGLKLQRTSELTACLLTVCIITLTHTHSHTHAHAHTHARTHPRAHSHTHSRTDTLTHTLTHSRTHFHTLSHTHSLTHTHIWAAIAQSV